MICQNCKSKHGCGCQARTATNGVSVCTTCIANYELQLKAKKATTPNAPSNVGVIYNPVKK